MAADSSDSYRKVEPSEIPLDDKGNCLIDVFVHLPSADRFVRFVCAGDTLSDEKKTAVGSHVDPNFFVLEKQFEDAGKGVVIPAEAPPSSFKIEVLGKEAQKQLKMIFKGFVDPSADPIVILKSIEATADTLLDVVAPDTKKLKEHLLAHLKHIALMNDVSALTSISILIAVATGFDSKKSYRDIAYAVLVMDAALSEFTDQEIEMYYRDRNSLPAPTLERILRHPIRSHELIEEKLKSLSDVSKQLVLSHHELFNGKGFPRGVRSESLFPLVKVLAFSVDIFESIRRGQFNKKPVSLAQAILDMREIDVEAHMRRHAKKLVDTVLSFLDMDAAVATNS